MLKKILVIDDDVLVLKTIKNLLVRRNFNVFSSKNSKEAFGIVENENMDLIICDIRMPGEDGLALMIRIKEYLLKKGVVVPFLFISGYASEDAPTQAMDMGALGYVLKPIDMDQLLSVVYRAIETGSVSSGGRLGEDIPGIIL